MCDSLSRRPWRRNSMASPGSWALLLHHPCQADSALGWVCSQNSAPRTDWTRAVAERLPAPARWRKPVAIEFPPPGSIGGAGAKNSGAWGMGPTPQAKFEQLLPPQRDAEIGRAHWADKGGNTSLNSKDCTLVSGWQTLIILDSTFVVSIKHVSHWGFAITWEHKFDFGPWF